MNDLPKKKVILGLVIFGFLCLGIISTMTVFKRFSGLITQAETYGGLFLLNPYGQLTLSPVDETIRQVTVFVDAGAGELSASVNGLEFELIYNPSELAIVNENGQPVTLITMESGPGSVFADRQVYPLKNQVKNGRINFSVAMLGEGAATGYSGIAAPVASFYIKPLANEGSPSLIFVRAETGSHEDNMHVYRAQANAPYSDILRAETQNGSEMSSLSFIFQEDSSSLPPGQDKKNNK